MKLRIRVIKKDTDELVAVAVVTNPEDAKQVSKYFLDKYIRRNTNTGGYVTSNNYQLRLDRI